VPEPTFDELIWPQPKTRREYKKLQQPEGISNSEYSNRSLIILWTINLILLSAFGITAAYITSLFIL
jgi:hypothetical protein